MKVLLVFALLAGEVSFGQPDGSAASSAAAGQKAIRRYALTSANDSPQRDPQDWRLLGSNDEGKSWVLLDIRKGEIFSERHQRRVFEVTNRAAFNVFRLQIDRVREPAQANSMQVAEIELLATPGEVDVGPIFQDLITSQGDNPPLETRFQAFDGKVETKWLDYANQHPNTRASWIQWQYASANDMVVTNMKQLLGLRSRASEGYPVQMEGVVLGTLAASDRLIVLHSAGDGAFEVSRDRSQEPRVSEFVPGQRVLVNGTSEWVDKRIGLREARLQIRGEKAPREPKRIDLEQSIGLEEEFEWVEAEGTIRFCGWQGERLVLDLEQNERTMSVEVFGSTSQSRGIGISEAQEPGARSQGSALNGAHVKIRGLCGGVLNALGQRVAGRLWVAGLADVSRLSGPEPAMDVSAARDKERVGGSSGGPLLTSIEQIRRLTPQELERGPSVKVRGTVIEFFGTYLQDETAGIEVWLRGDAQPQKFGECVEVEGKGAWGKGHGPVISADQIVSLGAGKLPKARRCSLSQLASGEAVDQWIEMEAVVRATDGSHMLLTCEGGQLMATIRSAAAPLVNRLVDATIRVRGVGVVASDDHFQVQGIQLLVPSLDYVDVEQPAADPFSLRARPIGSLLQVRWPKELVHRVKVEGVVTFRQGRQFFLQDKSGSAMALAREEVDLRLPAGLWHWVFWQSPNTNRAQELELSPGDQVAVAGFAEMQGDAPVLTEVVIRKLGRADLPTPIQATVDEIAMGKLDSTRVSLEGTVLGKETIGAHIVLKLQSGQQVFQAILQTNQNAPVITPGSRVKVAGVCQIEPIRYPELGKKVRSFELLVTSPKDLTILARPPWWTLKHTLAVMGTLAALLVVAVGWIRTLHRLVDQRTGELKLEIAAHEQTEAQLAEESRRVQAEIEEHKRTEASLAEKTDLLEQEIDERKLIQAELEEKRASLEKEIEERKRVEAEVERIHRKLLTTSRLAGMAEVATSVLHNVGNVLNSVNVLVSSVADQIQKSKVSGLAKLAALLSKHRTDLAHFMADDEQGKHLPGYLERLAAHLAEEQAHLQQKVKALSESIQHIKHIVVMQQGYAKVSGFLETVSPVEIMEDALRMHSGALGRHDIKVVREYEEVPPVTIDRHKVLQILVNLLQNAKQACDASRRPDRQVTVRISKNGEEKILVKVIDNGIGIPAENLPRIFGQGFSTRTDGHGFGLHSSVLAAQDMGGTLSADSGGIGKGATFVLEIPMNGKANDLKRLNDLK